jgi:hypothetical protein
MGRSPAPPALLPPLPLPLPLALPPPATAATRAGLEPSPALSPAAAGLGGGIVGGPVDAKVLRAVGTANLLCPGEEEGGTWRGNITRGSAFATPGLPDAAPDPGPGPGRESLPAGWLPAAASGAGRLLPATGMGLEDSGCRLDLKPVLPLAGLVEDAGADAAAAAARAAATAACRAATCGGGWATLPLLLPAAAFPAAFPTWPRTPPVVRDSSAAPARLLLRPVAALDTGGGAAGVRMTRTLVAGRGAGRTNPSSFSSLACAPGFASKLLRLSARGLCRKAEYTPPAPEPRAPEPCAGVSVRVRLAGANLSII